MPPKRDAGSPEKGSGQQKRHLDVSVGLLQDDQVSRAERAGSGLPQQRAETPNLHGGRPRQRALILLLRCDAVGLPNHQIDPNPLQREGLAQPLEKGDSVVRQRFLQYDDAAHSTLTDGRLVTALYVANSDSPAAAPLYRSE